MATAVQVLVRRDASARAVRLILDETTTLGVRRSSAQRETLERTIETLDDVRVKIASRPSGVTAKAEMSDLSRVATHAARQGKRQRAEQSVLDDDHDD